MFLKHKNTKKQHQQHQQQLHNRPIFNFYNLHPILILQCVVVLGVNERVFVLDVHLFTVQCTPQCVNVDVVTMVCVLVVVDKEILFVDWNPPEDQIHGELDGIKQYVHVTVIHLHQCKDRMTSVAAGCQPWLWLQCGV